MQLNVNKQEKADADGNSENQCDEKAWRQVSAAYVAIAAKYFGVCVRSCIWKQQGTAT